MRTALVIGATSYLGSHVIQQFLARGYAVTATKVRPWTPDYKKQTHLSVEQLHLLHLKPDDIRRWMKPFDCVVIIPPVTLVHHILPFLQEAGAKRIVCVSSHNTALFPESRHYASLVKGEQQIIDSGVDYAIVRPSMIIGHEKDHTVSDLMRTAKRRKFLPLPGDGRALQQPVDYLDLSRALVHAAVSPKTSRKIMSVGGPETLTLRELYTRIMLKLNLKPRIVSIPLLPLQWIAKLFELLHIPMSLKSSQFQRIRSDKHVGDIQIPDWEPRMNLDTTLTRLVKIMYPDLDPKPRSS